MTTQWLLIRNNIQKSLDSGVFKVWIAPLDGRVEDLSIYLTAPSSFVADWLKERLSDKIRVAAGEVLGCKTEQVEIHISVSGEPAVPTGRNVRSVSGELVVPTGRSVREARPVQLPLPVCSVQERNPFSWRFSFEDFVIGPSNEVAVAAARGLCGTGLSSSETLFLSSASGLGKTHLAQAIGRSVCESLGSCRVLYLTAEEFASRFVAALKTRNIESFKERLRSADVFLLEDVHFLQGKEKMQDEALATIKALQSKGSRVVLTSSFSPRELRNVDNQLVSHFCSGLITNISRPNLDTRRNILLEKARLHQVRLPASVADLLARRINSDVRQLESCLNNLIFKAKHLNQLISMDLASDVLGQFIQSAPPGLDIEKIISLVCDSFALNLQQLCSPSRRQECVMARNTIYYLARKHTSMSLREIGEQFNRRHTTVIKGITSLEREMSKSSRIGRQAANTLDLIERNAQ